MSHSACHQLCDMLIPVRCFTCGAVIANRWEAYVRAEHNVPEEDTSDSKSVEQKGGSEAPKVTRKKILDDLGIKSLCCRRHFLGNVDLMDKL